MKNFFKISLVIVLAAMMLFATVSCAGDGGKTNTPAVTTAELEQSTPTAETPTQEVPSQQTTESITTEAPAPTDPVVPEIGLTPGEDTDGAQYGDWISKA